MAKVTYDPKQLEELADQAAGKLQFWKGNPVAFVMEATNPNKNGKPSAWQANALKKLKRYKKVAIRSGHGVGKSRLLAWAIWWILCCHKSRGLPMKIAVTGPSGANTEDVVWSEISLVYGHLPKFLRDKFKVTKGRIECIESGDSEKDPWFASLRTSRRENPDALQGFHGNPGMFIIDEASGVPDAVFNVARGAMTDSNSYAIQTGNPTKLSGYFYKVFHPRSGKQEVWATMAVSCLDNIEGEHQEFRYIDQFGNVITVETEGRVSLSYTKEMESEYGPESMEYKIRVLGEFPHDEEETLVRRSWAQRAWERTDITYSESWMRVWGVDVAYRGSDDSALVKRRNMIIEEAQIRHGHDPWEVAQWVKGEFEDAKAAGKEPQVIAIDATGLGEGVVSTLRHMEPRLPCRLIAVIVNEKAMGIVGTKCMRLRDELWWAMRLWFKDKSPVFEEKDGITKRLIDEVSRPKYSYSDAGKVVVETKKEMKKRGVPSPDVAEALMVTFAVPGQDRMIAGDGKKKQQGRDHHQSKQQETSSGWMTC